VKKLLTSTLISITLIFSVLSAYSTAAAAAQPQTAVFWMCDVSGSMKNKDVQTLYDEAANVFINLVKSDTDAFNMGASKIISVGQTAAAKSFSPENCKISAVEPTNIASGFKVSFEAINSFLENNPSETAAFVISSDMCHTTYIDESFNCVTKNGKAIEYDKQGYYLYDEQGNLTEFGQEQSDLLAAINNLAIDNKIDQYIQEGRLTVYFIEYAPDEDGHLVVELPEALNEVNHEVVQRTSDTNDTELKKAFTLAYARLTSGNSDLDWETVEAGNPISLPNPLRTIVFTGSGYTLDYTLNYEPRQEKSIYDNSGVFLLNKDVKGSLELPVDAEIIRIPALTYKASISSDSDGYYNNSKLTCVLSVLNTDAEGRFEPASNSKLGNIVHLEMSTSEDFSSDTTSYILTPNADKSEYSGMINNSENFKKTTYYWRITECVDNEQDADDDVSGSSDTSGSFAVVNRKPVPKASNGYTLQETIENLARSAKDNIEISLNDFFRDADGDVLSYSISKNEANVELDTENAVLLISAARKDSDFSLSFTDGESEPIYLNYTATHFGGVGFQLWAYVLAAVIIAAGIVAVVLVLRRRRKKM